MDHVHRFVIYGSLPCPEAALLARCKCGLERFWGFRNGVQSEQILVDGEWIDHDGGWVKNYPKEYPCARH